MLDSNKLHPFTKRVITYHLKIHAADIIENHVQFFLDKGWVEAMPYRFMGWKVWCNMHDAMGLPYPVTEDINMIQLPSGDWVSRTLYNKLYYKLNREPTHEEIINEPNTTRL